ncbi:MAG: helix-turn-helix domain-containing protein [Legionellales bacterium]|nr:helix-turn-helix domain-containing protein [Legionellales bacterium]
MSMTSMLNEEMPMIQEKPGAQLAAQRVLRDYSPEYVAGKLHLRVRVIELLEADDYENMPEPVFIKGYLRAYAKLLGIEPEPLLVTFNALYSDEKKIERTLWQSSRQSNRAEYMVRWVTILLSLGVLVAVGLWWESSRGSDPILPVKLEQQALTIQPAPEVINNVRLTDLSKMRSLLAAPNQVTLAPQEGPLEKDPNPAIQKTPVPFMQKQKDPAAAGEHE